MFFVEFAVVDVAAFAVVDVAAFAVVEFVPVVKGEEEAEEEEEELKEEGGTSKDGTAGAPRED